MKRWLVIASIIIFLISEWMITLPVSLLWIKYSALAIAVFMMSTLITQRFAIHPIRGKAGTWIHRIALLILLLYVWLCLDTFLLGMKLPLSGMIRYGIFDFTLPLTLLFVIAGILSGASIPDDIDGLNSNQTRSGEKK